MEAQAYYTKKNYNRLEEMNRAELLDHVVSLREDVTSVAAEVRLVLDENKKLKAEVDRLRGYDKKEKPVANVNRMKQEIDELIRLHEAASSARTGRPEDTMRDIRPSAEVDAGSAWMKKMMMFMMLSEMV